MNNNTTKKSYKVGDLLDPCSTNPTFILLSRDSEILPNTVEEFSLDYYLEKINKVSTRIKRNKIYAKNSITAQIINNVLYLYLWREETQEEYKKRIVRISNLHIDKIRDEIHNLTKAGQMMSRRKVEIFLENITKICHSTENELIERQKKETDEFFSF